MAVSCKRCGHDNTDEARFCLQCGAMLEQQATGPDSGDPMIGRILLGRYRVLKVLGEGGMGKVYLAEQKMGTATRNVAIKTLHPELSGDPQLVARFHRECETVIQLHHPNTVQFYDFGDLEDKTLFIVMEFIEGEDLSKRLSRQGHLQQPMVDKLLIQICGSLSEAHSRGVVHRDLKPENVLLTTRGGQTDFVKVLDFGIAKVSEAEDEKTAKLTKQGMVLGTPPYMSPEQFSGQQLDLRSDIYSLAVMTFEMVTGRLPFEARTPWEWATKHLTAAPTPVTSLPGGAELPPHKAHAIMRGLSKNREERPASALDFMREVTGIGDPQVAWTMATTGSGSASVPRTAASYSPSASGHGGYGGGFGTPSPMPHSQAPHSPMPHSQAPHSQAPHGRPPQSHTPPPGNAPHGYGPTGTGPGVQRGPTPSGPFVPGPQGSHDSNPYGSYGSSPHAEYSSRSVDAHGAGYPSSGGHPMHTPTPGPTDYPSGPMAPVGGAGKWVGLLVLAFAVLGGVGGGLFWSLNRPPADPHVGPTPVQSSAGIPPTTSGDGTLANKPPVHGMDPPVENTDPPATMEAVVVGMSSDEIVGGEDESDEASGSSAMGSTMRGGGPSAAEIARARDAVGQGTSALARNDLRGAMSALSDAQSAAGRTHAMTRPLRNAVASRGNIEVGILLQQGNCPAAQTLFRSLRRVRADGPSRQHFSDWCARP